MAELAGDFGKLRLPLPKSFNGEPSDWEDWSWNFKSYSYLAIFQPDSVDFLARSETSNTEILDAHFTGALPAEETANMRMFSRKLHYLLANLCTGSARLLVCQNEAGNGFETWRRLSQRFSLPDATRHVSLLKWKFNTQTFEQDFNAWETVKAKYEQQTGTPIPHSVLVATLMNKTSDPSTTPMFECSHDQRLWSDEEHPGAVLQEQAHLDFFGFRTCAGKLQRKE